MSKNNKFMKNIILHIKYPYTALIISMMWLSMSIIIVAKYRNDLEILIGAMVVCTLIIAATGFRTPK